MTLAVEVNNHTKFYLFQFIQIYQTQMDLKQLKIVMATTLKYSIYTQVQPEICSKSSGRNHPWTDMHGQCGPWSNSTYSGTLTNIKYTQITQHWETNGSDRGYHLDEIWCVCIWITMLECSDTREVRLKFGVEIWVVYVGIEIAWCLYRHWDCLYYICWILGLRFGIMRLLCAFIGICNASKNIVSLGSFPNASLLTNIIDDQESLLLHNALPFMFNTSTCYPIPAPISKEQPR